MSDTPYGITIGASNASGTLSGQAITDMQAIGITWLRYQVPWRTIDTSGTTSQNAANYVWTAWDSAVQQCNATGINICLTIFHAPSQFTTGSNPLAPGATATFASQIAGRYNGGSHGRVQSIEVGNEDYNSGADITSIPASNAQALLATMNAAYPAIKAVNAKIKVGAAAKLQRNSAGYTAWFDTLLKPPAVKADYLNFHYYTGLPTSGGTAPNLVPVNLDPSVDVPTYNGGQGIPSITTAWKLIRNKMQQYGTTMDVWCTETGFAINTNPSRSTYFVVSQATQWAYLKAVMDSCRTSGIVTHIYPFTLGYYTGYTAPNYRDGMSLVQGPAGSPQYTTAFTSYKAYTRTYPTWGAISTGGTTSKTAGMRLVVRSGTSPGGGGTRSTGIRLNVASGGTVYLLGLASTTLPSANQLVATTLAAPTTSTTDTKLGSAVNWGEVTSQGTTSAWAAAVAAPAPSGKGFLWDDSTLEAQSLLPGTFTASLRLNSSGAGATTVGADIHCRLYKRSSGGTYTLIADCLLAGQAILTTQTVFHPVFTTTAGLSFLSGDKLYLDILLRVTSNSGPSTQNITLSDLSTNSSGGMSTADVITPGYTSIGGGGGGSGGTFTGFAARVLALAPQAFYRLDETVGTIAHDSSGNGYDATVSGATLSQPGAFIDDTCMAFTAGGGLTLPITLKPYTWEAASLLFWVNLNDGTGWHFIVFVANASGIAAYLDSVLTQGSTGSAVYLGENFDFAGTLATGGSLDDVALLNFDLSLAQIATLYGSLSGVSQTYLQTNLNGANATWTWDTSNLRLLGIQASGVRGVLQYTGFLRADMYVEADFNLSDSGGIVVRMTDSKNAYLLSVHDSASASNPNTIRLYKVVAGTLSALSSPIPTPLPRGHITRFRLDAQGTQLSASVDGIVLVTVSDVSITSAGSGGILCGLSTNESVQCYSLRIQPYGDDLNGKHLLTRLTLTSADPTSTPQVRRLATAAYGSQIGVGTLIPSVDNRKVFMNRILDDAATQSNYIWNIDQNRELSFNYRQAVPAPWVLQSGNTGLPSDIELDTNLLVEVSGDLYRNRQTLTNVTQTAHYPDEFVGDGQTQSFTLRYPIAVGTVPTITLLPDETTLLVGKKGTSGADWYYAEGDATIAQDTAGTPLSVFARIHVDYTGTFTDDVTVDNKNAQDALAILQGGGTGIVEAVEDGKGMFYDAALSYAQSLLDRYCVTDAQGKPTGRTLTFLTYRDGLSVGMLLSLFVPEENLYGVHVQITAIDMTVRTQPQSTLLYAYLVTATELAATHSWQKFIASGFLD